MSIEAWNSPYIVIWLWFGVLMTVLTYGVQGYNGKVSTLGAAGYGMVIVILSGLDGAALGQYMYDETAKYDVWGSIGTALGVSGPLLVSGVILLVFYRFRVVKHPEEVMIKNGDVEVVGSNMLSGMFVIFWVGILLLGIGLGHIVRELKAGRAGFFYGSLPLIPFILSFVVMAKYQKWIFKYIVWVLRRKGLLQVVNEKNNIQEE